MASQIKVSVILKALAETKGFQAVNQELRSIEIQTKKIQPSLDAMKTAFAGVAVAAGALAFVAKIGIDLGSKITDLSAQADMSTEAFQVLSLAAMDSGVSMEEVSKAMVKMRQSVQDARDGNEGMTASLAKLNLSAAGLQALAPERQFELIASRINMASDRQAALNAAMDIFGAKNAPKLIATLKQLSEQGYDSLAESTKKIRLDDAQLKTLDDAGDKLTRMAEALKYMASLGTAKVLNSGILDKALAPYNAAIIAMRGTLAGTAPVTATGAVAGAPASMEAVAAPDPAAAARAAAYDAAAAKARDQERLDAQRKLHGKLFADEMEFTKKLNADAKRVGASVSQDIEAQTKASIDAGKAMTDAYATPVEKAQENLKIAAELQAAGNLTADTYARVGKALADATETERIEKLRKSLNPLQKAFADCANQIEGHLTGALTDMVMTGKLGMKELGTAIMRDLVAALIRAQIVIPLMRAISSASGMPGLFGAPAAEGGYRDGSKPYLVGEEGPEIFNPGGGGTITPADVTAQSMDAASSGGGGGGDTQVINLHFTNGVTRSELSAQMPVMIKQIKEAVSDSVRRGGSYRRAYA
jgi:hypothetical protein